MQVAAGIISWLVGFEHCSSDFNAWKIVGIWAVVNGIIAVKLVNHIRIGGKLFMIRYVGNRFIPILVWLRTWQNRVSWVVVDSMAREDWLELNLVVAMIIIRREVVEDSLAREDWWELDMVVAMIIRGLR